MAEFINTYFIFPSTQNNLYKFLLFHFIINILFRMFAKSNDMYKGNRNMKNSQAKLYTYWKNL